MKKTITAILIAALMLCSAGCIADPADNSSVGDTSVNTVSGTISDEASDISEAEESDPAEESRPVDTSETSYPAETSEEYGEIGSVDAAGLFESDYGCGVDMLVCWLLTGDESGDLTFTADIYLVSYEMRSTAHYGDCRLVINGETHYFSAPEVDVEATKTTVTTLLSTETVTVPRNSDGTASLDVTVVYPFRGTYNSVSLPVIEAATVITVSADGSVDFR
ncbi:MAG: hypothetical protein PUC63_00955 [Clostridiales bacterium]|nr:hypothetical protein [Clostridiales bacterium]